jgi:RNA polymerase sigma factor (sigma-70 family)
MLSAELNHWFTEHVQKHEPALRAYLGRRFPALPDHDDLVQDVYARLLRFEDPSRLAHPKAYLFTMAHNAAIDKFRRCSSQPVENFDDGSDHTLLEEAPDVVESIESRQRREVLIEAMRALPERCREVMFLRYLEGCSGKDIAARLDISLGTVKGHLLKGVRDCARFFEARGLIETVAEKDKEVS